MSYTEVPGERVPIRMWADPAQVESAAMDQLRTTGCTEYVDPLSGEPLGSDAQSWTAAVALDWLGPE